MKYSEFLNGVNKGIYKENQLFWVCDVRENNENIGQYYRQLKPTPVFFRKKGKEQIYFVKSTQKGKPSQTKVSIEGHRAHAKPFLIFESRKDCYEMYTTLMKRVFVNINHHYDEYRKLCKEALGYILEELQYQKNQEIENS